MKNLFLVTNQFSLFGLSLTWYGVIIAFAMIVGIVIAILICKKKRYDTNLPIDLALFTFPCAIIGARLYYCIFNGVNSFIEVFEIWRGGLAIYGGVIGGFLGVLLCSVVKKIPLSKCCDLAAPCLILGQSIGRIGCYFAGCCYGVETTSEWLMFFPLSVKINGVWHLSTFFYESFFDLIGFIVLIILTFKTKKQWIVTSWYFIIYGLVRFVLEAFRDPVEALFIGSVKVSQLLSGILVIVGICLFIFSILNNRNNKGEEVISND